MSTAGKLRIYLGLILGLSFLAAGTAMAAGLSGIYTPEILNEFDGQEGPAYVAVQGRVYDVTESWSSGSHYGLTAGLDQTDGIQASPHGSDVLADLEQVGYYIEKALTPGMLAEYDGQEGRSAYVAVDGIVYDLSEQWADGSHRGHQAGNDLSDEFEASPHDQELLEELEVVGILVDRSFSVEELAEYNGQEGRDAYAAVDGLVYDLTEVWPGGSHRGLEAGQDLTEEIEVPNHGRTVLADLPVVGILGEAQDVGGSSKGPGNDYWTVLLLGGLVSIGSIFFSAKTALHLKNL